MPSSCLHAGHALWLVCLTRVSESPCFVVGVGFDHVLGRSHSVFLAGVYEPALISTFATPILVPREAARCLVQHIPPDCGFGFLVVCRRGRLMLNIRRDESVFHDPTLWLVTPSLWSPVKRHSLARGCDRAGIGAPRDAFVAPPRAALELALHRCCRKLLLQDRDHASATMLAGRRRAGRGHAAARCWSGGVARLGCGRDSALPQPTAAFHGDAEKCS